MRPRTTSLIHLNAAVLLWGGTAMFAKGVDLPVNQTILLRSLIAAAAMVPVLAASGAPVGMRRGGHYAIMALSGALMAVHWVTYFTALRIAGAAVAILALHTYPVVTALIEPFLFGEKLRKIDILLAAAVFAGVGIMTPELTLTNDITRGIAVGVLSGLLFMARNLLVRKYVRSYTSSTLMFWQFLVSGVVLLPVAAPSLDAGTLSLETVGLLALLGVVFTALPQTLYASSLRHLSAKTVGVLATLLPFYGAFWGYLIWGEQLTARTALGGLLILGCIVFETFRSVKA